jgi:hypothetical protein
MIESFLAGFYRFVWGWTIEEDRRKEGKEVSVNRSGLAKIRWTSMQLEWKGLKRKDARSYFFGRPLQGISASIGNIERWWRCHCISDLPSGDNQGAVTKAFRVDPGSGRSSAGSGGAFAEDSSSQSVRRPSYRKFEGANTNSNGLGTDSGNR